MAEDKKTLEQLDQELAAAERLKKSKKEILEIEKQIAETLADKAAQLIKEASLMDQTDEDVKEILATEQAIFDQQVATIKKKEEELAVLEKIKTAIEEQKSAQEEILDIVGSIGAKYENTILDKIAKSQVSIGQLGAAFKQNFSIDRISGAAFDAFVDSMGTAVVSAMTARTEFAKATGAGNSFDDTIGSVAATNNALGVSFSEAAAATQSLFNNMSGFTSMSVETQNALAATAAELESIGISSDTTAAQVEYTTRVMGLSGNQAKAQAESMRTFAMNAGIAPAKMAQEFAAAGPKIAQYGSEAGKVFKGLALQSKKLGIEMNDLLSITQQFDTFEGAANAAGQLNAVLGGPFLNSMELLTAETEEQRVAMLQSSLQMAGKSFDSMSKFEKMALANAAGISDMSVAAKMFGSSSQKMAAEHKMLGLTAEQVKERQEAAVSVTKKLQASMESLAVVVMPIVDTLSLAASAIANFAQNNQTLVRGLLITAGLVFVLRKGAMLYHLAKNLVIGSTKKEILQNILLGNSQEKLSKGTDKMGKAGKKSSSGMKSLGKSLKHIGKGLSSVGIGLIKVGLGVLKIGLGIGLAAAGIALLIYSFTNLLKVVIESIDVMPRVVGAIMELGVAFAILGPGLALAGIGFVVFAAGLAIGVTILAAMIPTAILASIAIGIISAAVFGLGVSFMFVGSGISSISESISSAVEGMRELSGENGVAKFVTVIDSIDDSNIDNLGKLMDEAERLVVVNAQLSALEATQAVGSAINKLISFVAPDAASSESKKKEIVLQINDREFGRAVVEALDDDMKLSLA